MHRFSVMHRLLILSVLSSHGAMVIFISLCVVLSGIECIRGLIIGDMCAMIDTMKIKMKAGKTMKYIFLHGMGQNPSCWDKVLSCMSEKTEAECPELSVFCRDGECLYGRMYSAFSEYCGSFGEPVVLCGLSLGAVLALNYAIDHPNRVSALILIAPQYKMPKKMLKFQNFLFRFMPEKQFADIGMKKNDFISLTNSMADIDMTCGLDKVKCPTLVLCGERDNVNKKSAEQLSEKLCNSKSGIIKNAGHEANKDAPKELAEMIENFINGDVK